MFNKGNDVVNIILPFTCIKDIVNMSKTCKFLNRIISELYSSTDIYRKIANYIYNIFDSIDYSMEIYGGFILDSLRKTKANDLDIVIYPTKVNPKCCRDEATCFDYSFRFSINIRNIIDKEFGSIIDKKDSYATDTLKIKLNNEIYNIDISFFCFNRKVTYDFDITSLSMDIKDFIDNGIVRENIHTLFDKYSHRPMVMGVFEVLPTLDLEKVFKNIDNEVCVSLVIEHGKEVLQKTTNGIRYSLYSKCNTMVKHRKRYGKMRNKGFTITNWILPFDLNFRK